MWKIKAQSPAKLNLHLDVAPPGKKGFHPLRSLFVMVSLYDELTVESTSDESCTIKSNCPFPQEDNILYKAWALCREEGFYRGGLKITLNKKIPSGAGLGGGSGNGATLLRILYERSDRKKEYKEWIALAAKLGSDVPFFMESPAAVVTGRGEFIHRIKPRRDFYILIVFPQISIGTPGAFKELDKQRAQSGFTHDWALTGEQIEEIYHDQNPQNWEFFNSFTPSCYKTYPKLQDIDRTLLTLGADFVSLSGSGSAMVGIFQSQGVLEKAKRALNNKFPATYAVRPLDVIPFGIVI